MTQEIISIILIICTLALCAGVFIQVNNLLKIALGRPDRSWIFEAMKEIQAEREANECNAAAEYDDDETLSERITALDSLIKYNEKMFEDRLIEVEKKLLLR